MQIQLEWQNVLVVTKVVEVVVRRQDIALHVNLDHIEQITLVQNVMKEHIQMTTEQQNAQNVQLELFRN